ncbi:MAG TPA: YggT family protein [Candidatus Binataceae bacterium]|jgi:YggT family protein
MNAYTSLIVWVASTLSAILSLYFYVVIASAILSWIEPNPYNPIVRFIYSITEPVFDWIRRHLPVFFGGIDFSPWIVVIAISFIQQWLLPNVERALVGG